MGGHALHPSPDGSAYTGEAPLVASVSSSIEWEAVTASALHPVLQRVSCLLYSGLSKKARDGKKATL